MSTAATAGATPANQVQVQVRAGVVSMTAGAPVKVITFSSPMIALNYTVLLEPIGTPQVAAISNKTINGFTLTLHANATVRWLAVYAI